MLLPIIAIFVIFSLIIVLIYYARSCYKYKREFNNDEEIKISILY